jgi:hypothetical protein
VAGWELAHDTGISIRTRSSHAMPQFRTLRGRQQPQRIELLPTRISRSQATSKFAPFRHQGASRG